MSSGVLGSRSAIQGSVGGGDRRIGFEVVDRAGDLGAGHAVDGGMVDLRDDPEAARRQAADVVEALDDVELPERLRGVERARMQARRLDAELAPVTGLRQRDVAHVEFHVEVRIVDPVGVVEIEGDAHGALAEGAREVQAALDGVEDVLETNEAVRRRRRVVHGERTDVHGLVRRLEIEE